MAMLTEAEVQAQFARFLEARGFEIKGVPVMDGEWHRAPVGGDKNKEMSGRYKGFTDGWPSGVAINFRVDANATRWKADGPIQELTPEERQAAKDAAEARRATEAERHQRDAQQAAERARGIWERAQPASPDHPYLQRKGISGDGLRAMDVEVHRNPWNIAAVLPFDSPLHRQPNAVTEVLLVPMRDADGALFNVQAIEPGGGKAFMARARVEGGHMMIGRPLDGVPLQIAEGYATAMAVNQVTELPTAVAFNAGNLGSVVRDLRQSYPNSPLIIMADNDHELPTRALHPLPNVGIEKAQDAAEKYGAKVVAPTFTPADKRMSDWNDVHRRDGIGAMRDSIRQQAVPALSSDAQLVIAALTEELGRQLPNMDEKARRAIISEATMQLSAQEMRDGAIELTEKQRGLAANFETYQQRRGRAAAWVEEQIGHLHVAGDTRQYFDLIHTETFEASRQRLRIAYPALSEQLEEAIADTRERLRPAVQIRMQPEPQRDFSREQENSEQLERAR